MLAGLDGDAVRLELERSEARRADDRALPLADIGEARLVLTDALIRETLRKAEAASARETGSRRRLKRAATD